MGVGAIGREVQMAAGDPTPPGGASAPASPAAPATPGAALPQKPGQIQHIFRNAPGHLPDTPANRAMLEGLANDPVAVLGTDKYGNTWAARINADGTQIWVQYRNGVIINGGVNTAPRTYNPQTGLSGPKPP
jgi:filamentous hemagglutinin